MNEPGWTIETLKTHLESRIDAVEDAAKLALEAADKAAMKADSNFEKRMDTTNEWRGALEDQAKAKASVQQVNALKEQMDKLERRVAAIDNKAAGGLELWQIIGGIIVVVAAVFGMLALFSEGPPP